MIKRCAQIVELGAQPNNWHEIFIRNHRERVANRRTVLSKIRSDRATCPRLAQGVAVFRGVLDRANQIAPSPPRTTSTPRPPGAVTLYRSTHSEKVRARP